MNNIPQYSANEGWGWVDAHQVFYVPPRLQVRRAGVLRVFDERVGPREVHGMVLRALFSRGGSRGCVGDCSPLVRERGELVERVGERGAARADIGGGCDAAHE
jgi:hypothetical protein